VNAATHVRSFCNGLRMHRAVPFVAANVALAFGVAMLFAAAPASANLSHAFSTNITGSGASTLSGPTDVEVDQESHDIYVTDPGNRRVEKFNEKGEFLFMFGKGVNKTAVEIPGRTSEEDICPATGHPGDVCQEGTSASSTGAFESPYYLAVDNSGGPSTGDVYVGDTGDNLVSKFDASGQIITSWGASGQMDGTNGIDPAVGGPNGTLYVTSGYYVNAYNQDGTPGEGGGQICGTPWLKADAAGDLYFISEPFYCDFGPGVAEAVPPVHSGYGLSFYPMGTDASVAGFGFDPSSGELYQDNGSVIDHYSGDCNPPVNGPCEPVDSFGSGHLSGSSGVAVDDSSHTVYVANSTSNDVAVFGDARPVVTTGPPSGATESEVTLTGHVDPAGRGDITSCHFEYGFDKPYGATVPCTPDPSSSNFTGPTDVTAAITGLSPGTHDHYRLVATNSAGATSHGLDQTFITTAPPAVAGLSSANVTATSADLKAQVNPNGLEATYQFDYGTSTSYGQVAPVPDGTVGASNSDQAIGVHLENLIPHAVYHYRLVATNADGTTSTGDQTFTFYPPSCPNANIRQQTRSNYLPDCRAYELVSPGDAEGTQLYPFGPNPGYATSPSRFSYTGLFSTIPNSGGSPIDGSGDLYVATRTDTGWVSRYVGWPSTQAAVDGGPAMGPPGSAFTVGPGIETLASNLAANGIFGPRSQDGVITDSSMDTFLSFNDGNQSVESIYDEDFLNATPIASNAPYVFGADGSLRDRWPTDLAAVPDGSYPPDSLIYTRGGIYPSPGEQPAQSAPGGLNALNCPFVQEHPESGLTASDCPGDVTASSDLSHFVFATEWNVFAIGGQLSPPGSVYDNNTAADTLAVASKTPAGSAIPEEPTDQAGDPLQIPAVSSDGSHILIAAGGTGPCGATNCPLPPCGSDYSATIRCPMQPSHLYMRVDDSVTYDVSVGHDVTYVGMTSDGSKVYFTSEEHLTNEDLEHGGTSLYMWSEQGEKENHPLTLISKGDNPGNPGEPGNTDTCNATFATKCSIATFTTRTYCENLSGLNGNCLSDNFIASENGDVYFFSPEQLDGSRGIPNQENLYDYRGGQVQYVATFTSGPFCNGVGQNQCTETPVVRMQVSPDDSHMAFVTASPVTHYDNAGHLEMYTYDPSTGEVACASCNPDGEPPTADVHASMDGLFMTNDGRVFFFTTESLVPQDTDEAEDVYEYAGGRPQLITPGTGEPSPRQYLDFTFSNTPGLIGVSADGRDVYFSTFDTLVSQDHNGAYIKMYDARSGGGFPAPPPPPPCQAADECHGPGTPPPNLPTLGTSATLTGGNANPGSHRHHHKKRKRVRHERSKKHRAKRHRKGSVRS